MKQGAYKSLLASRRHPHKKLLAVVGTGPCKNTTVASRFLCYMVYGIHTHHYKHALVPGIESPQDGRVSFTPQPTGFSCIRMRLPLPVQSNSLPITPPAMRATVYSLVVIPSHLICSPPPSPDGTTAGTILRALLLLWAAHHQHQNASTTGGTHLFTIPTHLSPATAPPRSILRESTIHHIYLLHKVLGTDNGNILALPSGAGFGTTTSHRAEARGMLSGTVFMQRPPFFLHKQEQTSQLKHT